MANLIEHEDSGDGNVVRVGDSDATVSLKVYQDVYHQITGRTEQIRKRYSDNLLIELPELEQLHYKVMQLCDVHRVVARNEVVSVFHEKERKEQFTSFERFLAYNTNTASPTVTVLLRYNFSIIPAGIQKPQEYVVTVRLTSRVALLKEAETDAPPFMRGSVVTFVTENTAEINVDYADYVIARGFLEAFDEWIRGCRAIPKKRWLNRLQKWSHLIPYFLRMIIVVVIVTYALRSVPDFFATTPSTELLARFIVLYFGASFVLLSLVSAAGEMIENAIDTYPVLSYLKLNKGDSKLIEEFQERRNRIVLRFLGGAVLSIILGVLSAKLERLM